MRELFEKWKRNGTLRDEEMVILTKQGQRRTVLLNAGSVKDADGKLLHSTSVQVDVTERKRIQERRLRAEEALRRSEERSRELVLRAPVAMVVNRGRDEKNELVNLKFTELFGYTIEDVPDESHWWPLAYPDAVYRERIKSEWLRRVEKASRQKADSEPMEASVHCKDGSIRHIEFHFSSFGDTSLVSFVDLTDRQRAELTLRESEERFRLLSNSAPVMIWMSGPDKLCTYFNQSWLKFTGRLIHAELGNGWAGGVHAEDLKACLDTYTSAFDRRESFEMEYRLRRHDGEYRWIFDLGVPRFNPDGSFAGYIGSCVDITEQKLAEEARSKMSHKLIEVQDQERRWLARELHDDITQRISLLAFDLQFLERNLPSSRVVLRERLAEEFTRLSELASDVEALSHRLHSSTLQRKGLATAAAGCCREFSQRQKLPINFSSEGTLDNIPDAISLCLFRVLQEALHNAVKHSGARRFEVSLVGASDEIVLTVRDEGRGFDPEEALAETGLGLTSMKERLKLVDGHLSIDSKLRSGTTIHARVPVSSRMKSAGAVA